MKKILFILFFVFIYSCSFNNIDYNSNSFEYKDNTLIKLLVNEYDNGLILIKDKLYRIENLNIINNSIFSLDENNYPINFIINKDVSNISLLNFSYVDKIQPLSFGFPKYKQKFKLISIKKDSIFTNEKDLFIDAVTLENFPEFIELDENNYVFFYSNQEKEKNNNYAGQLVLKVINKNNIKNVVLENNFIRLDLKLDLKIDKLGNGWYSYSSPPKYFKLKNFEKSDQILDEVFDLNNSKIYETKNYLDEKGNGLILTEEQNLTNITTVDFYVYVIENFNKIGNKKLLLSLDRYGKDQIFDFVINKNGDGIFLMYKNILDGNNKIVEYTYFRTIKKFEVLETQSKIFDSKKSYYSSSINEKGNGLIIFKDNSQAKEMITIKKLRDFQMEKTPIKTTK